jgi:outer membrane protein OmpA-like peptidoglycan-associated protein
MRRKPGAAVLLLAAFLAAAPGLWAERFAFTYAVGDAYRILSTVREDVFVNRRLSFRSEILNRIAVEVLEAGDGAGRHRAVFQTAERALGAGGAEGGRSFEWAREYVSEFQRDGRGFITIDRRFYMPVVRNVEVYPDRHQRPGDSWSAEGEEAHDFGDSFGIDGPYRIPFTADYVFLGEREWRGALYPAFSVSYRIFAEPPPAEGRVRPLRIRGASDQVVFWRREMGLAAAYAETFRMVFELSDGRVVEYCGTAEAEVLGSPRMDREGAAQDINGDIADMGIDDAAARAVDEGIAVNLGDLRFQADSAELLPEDREKLAKIAELFRGRFPDRDILVGGHTALAGTAEGRLRLSRDRAAAVADFLIAEGVREPGRVMVRGYGAEMPLGDNDTEEGRRQNRRVEIIILEN